jgi:hypothetical protein
VADQTSRPNLQHFMDFIGLQAFFEKIKVEPVWVDLE